MEKTLSELIREYKDGGKRNFEKIAEKMNPLIEFYARKLYTWDREDARQEMLLALFLSLEKMKYCRNEGEMLSYLKTGIRRRYKDLMLKELHNKEETVYAEWTEVQDERDDFAISEFYMNLESALEKSEKLLNESYFTEKATRKQRYRKQSADSIATESGKSL